MQPPAPCPRPGTVPGLRGAHPRLFHSARSAHRVREVTTRPEQRTPACGNGACTGHAVLRVRLGTRSQGRAQRERSDPLTVGGSALRQGVRPTNERSEGVQRLCRRSRLASSPSVHQPVFTDPTTRTPSLHRITLSRIRLSRHQASGPRRITLPRWKSLCWGSCRRFPPPHQGENVALAAWLSDPATGLRRGLAER